MTHAGAAGAHTRPAGSARCRVHERDRARGAARRADPGLAAAGAARGDPRRPGDGDVRDHLLPPLVPAGALRRTVRAAGQRKPSPRPADRRATRGNPRSRRSAAGHQPHDQRGADRALGAAAGRPRAQAAVSAPRRGAGYDRSAHPSAGRQGAHGAAVRACDDQDGCRARGADGARRAPERIPGSYAAARLDPRISVWRDGGAGTRLRRAGLRRRAEATRVRRRQAGDRRRPGRTRVLLRSLPARPPGDPARGGQRLRLPGPEHARADGAEGRLQPEGDARPRAADRGRKGAARGDRTGARGRQTGGRRGVRGARPAQRADARDALLADVRPEQVRQTADRKRICRAGGQGRGIRRSGAGTADRPRGQRHLPDRLDVQADHRDGHAGSRRDQPDGGPRRGPVHPRLHRAVLQCRQGRLRPRRAGGSAEGVLRHVLLRSRQARQQPRQRQMCIRDRAGGRPADGCRPAERDHRAGARPRVAGEGRAGGAELRATQARLKLRHLRRASVERRRQHAPGGRPGRPAYLGAADGRRLLDARQRLHQRRRRLGGAPAPGDGDRRLPGPARPVAELSGAAPRAPQRLRSEPRDAGHPRGRQPAGGHLRGCVGGMESVPAPGVRKDGHRRTRRQGRPVVVHLLPPRPEAADRARGDRRTGRIRRRNGGSDRPPAGRAVVRPGQEVRRRELAHVLSPLSPITASEQAQPVADRSQVGPRTLRLPLDPLLTLAVIGLAVCSVVTLGAATRDLVPGQPSYYVDRQLTYLIVGSLLMVALSRLDYARLRPLKSGIYGLLIFTIRAVLALGHAARGSQRAINLPFFSFQASELGKVLLTLALAALVVDRARRLRDRDTTALVMLAALVPAMFVIAQPDLGSGLVYVVIALTLLFVAGTSWKHLAGLLALGAVALTFVLVAAPAAGIHVLKPYQVQRLTAFLHPTTNAQKEGYQQEESKIAIGSGQKFGRGPNATQTRLN